jgi:uncharacterized protein (DUF1697 family)
LSTARGPPCASLAPDVARYAAFLRAINVGGHTVKMAALRVMFEELGFGRVETFIASGNVIFDSSAKDEHKLERVVERALETDLGYPVETFVRSMGELTEISGHNPFDRPGPDGDDRSVYVAFLGRRPTSEAVQRLAALASEDDTFAVVGREAWWLRRGGIGESRFSGGLLEKTLGMPATLRGLPTIMKIVARHG